MFNKDNVKYSEYLIEKIYGAFYVSGKKEGETSFKYLNAKGFVTKGIFDAQGYQNMEAAQNAVSLFSEEYTVSVISPATEAKAKKK